MSVTATVLGAVLLCAGVLAGIINRQVLDGQRFASHAEAVVRDPAVSRQVGRTITDQVVRASPDLLAVRPLIEAAATSVTGSRALAPIVRVAAAEVHRAFIEGGSSEVVFRLADVGAVLAGGLAVVAPNAPIPSDLSVTLARAGEHSFAAEGIHLARIASTLSWALPMASLLLFAAGLLLAPNRPSAVIRTGGGVLLAGVGVGVVAIICTALISAEDATTLRGALFTAAWHQLSGAFWWAAAIAAVAGGMIIAVGASLIPQLDLDVLRRLRTRVLRPPVRISARIGRGAVLAAIGAAAVFRPIPVLTILATVCGILLLVVGMGEMSAAASTRRTRQEAAGHRFSWRIPAILAAVVALALVSVLVVIDSQPGKRRISAASDLIGCNGHVELCNKRYDQVAFPATHNSMSAADEPGWFVPEQPTGLIGQLDAGIRILLIDTWYGQPTARANIVVTAPGQHDEALAQANELFGKHVVDSALRLRKAISPTPTGAARPYLCHSLCELGATLWEPAMVQVRQWVAAHPRDVVTLFIQDQISVRDTASVLSAAGLTPYLHKQEVGQPWPTLESMIDSGKRVVVLMENHPGGKTYPALLDGFHWVQDTPYSNPTQADLSCRLNRGATTSPLFLVNYWLNDTRTLVSDSRRINSYDVLRPYLAKCQRERHHLPNFIAVNFYNYGDLFRVIDQLNGVK